MISEENKAFFANKKRINEKTLKTTYGNVKYQKIQKT